MCVGRWLAAAVKNHKATFPFLYFSVTKSTKSHLRGLSSLLKNSFRVHELVARAMRGTCVRQRIKRKSVVLPLSTVSAIPRVRTYRTKEPSRFVHALSARPLDNGWRGRESGAYADGMESVFFILSVGYTRTLSCRGINTYAKHVCWRRRDRGRTLFSREKHKVTFPLSYFCMTKSTKSHIRSFLPYVSSLHLPALLYSNNHRPPVRT